MRTRMLVLGCLVAAMAVGFAGGLLTYHLLREED